LVKSLFESFCSIIKIEDQAHGDYTKGDRFVVMLPAVDKRLLFINFYRKSVQKA